ncbi:hypothetical protein [Staphylococcus cohnii]|uniref:hypothetical protein n=1 Tax=Staphylococcus cohnii TaxID=29382 RepID=UPI0018D4E8E4|nr:hypothetical protein [Staphylococcus cohnii]
MLNRPKNYSDLTKESFIIPKDPKIGEQIKILDKDDTNKVMMVQKEEKVTVLSYDNAKHIYAEK